MIAQSQSVGIGTIAPDSSAMLDLTSGNQGFLPPRVSLLSLTDNENPVHHPAVGLLVYNIGATLPKGYYYWDGEAWDRLPTVEPVPAPAPAASERFTVGDVPFDMRPLAGGTFDMGAQNNDPNAPNYDPDANSDEENIRPVTITPFSIAETEVTQALWKAVMGSNPSIFQGNNYGDNLERPVEKVKWDDICGEDGFLAQLNAQLSSELAGRHFDLPTEAQWEYAARGGNAGSGHKYAGSDDVNAVAWYNPNSHAMTHAVKQKQPNECGLYDMSGNVWEYCKDTYSEHYPTEPQTDPANTENGSYVVIRGGGFDDNEVNCRVSDRSSTRRNKGVDNFGFRLALVPD